MPPVVAITGAAGNLGSRLRAHLGASGGWRLQLLDIDPRGDPAIHRADLSHYSPDWVEKLRGIDVLVHFAGNRDPAAGWPALLGPNIDAIANLYRAAVEVGVRRVILASSVFAMAARRNDTDPIGTPPADPGDSAYGASKLFAERLGAAYAGSHGIATLALRMGGCPPGTNLAPLQDRWANEHWLSTRDFLRAMDCALQADFTGFRVINLTSANPAGRWSLAEARELIGYEPADTYRAPAPPAKPSKPSTPSLPRRIVRRLRRVLRPG